MPVPSTSPPSMPRRLNGSNSCAKPRTALSGVRSSWLMLERNSDFARLAASASSLARCDAVQVRQLGDLALALTLVLRDHGVEVFEDSAEREAGEVGAMVVGAVSSRRSIAV
jgi:hypothetical protein